MPVAIMRLSEDLRLLHTARSGSWYTEYTTWSQHGKELKLREIFPIKFPFMAILILYSLRNFLAFGINNKITLFFAFWTIGWSLDSPFANWRLPIVRHYCPNWSQICCRWNQALFYYRERFCALTPKFLRNAPTISHPGKCCHIWTNILFFFFFSFLHKTSRRSHSQMWYPNPYYDNIFIWFRVWRICSRNISSSRMATRLSL